jgi:hypothetical protein
MTAQPLQLLLRFILIVFCGFGQVQALHAEILLEEFRTDDGKCSLTEKNDLVDQSEGAANYSYTLNNTEIFQNRGISRAALSSDGLEVIIPPLTRLNCLTKSSGGGKTMMLVTAAEPTNAYCGWVDVDNLLEANAENDLAFGPDISPCGTVQPVSIRNFCSEIKEIHGDVEGCSAKVVGRSVIKTKFITDNTSNIEADHLSRSEQIPLYSSAQTTNEIGTINIFTILEVFDQAKNTETGALRLLVGIEGKDLKGWIDYNSGTVWYSNLSAYFAREGSKDVFKNKIGVRNNQILAQRPSNLEQTLDSDNEFPRFPVLFDHRLKKANTPAKIRPNLQVAFIGRFCGENQASLCSAGDEMMQNKTNFDSADIMFLIDGTSSMKKYFSLVSKAVKDFTKSYIDNPDYRFGVAMYGDFKEKSKTTTTDTIDFKLIDKLQINFGDLFNRLDKTELFIKDVMKDKEEATDAAIYNAVMASNWKEKRLRFLIHIGDHGDRVNPSELTLDKMKENNIFYIPVAVKGEGVIGASEKFVKQANRIFEKYRTASDVPMALEPIVTYQQNIDELEAIAQALVGSLDTGKRAERERQSEIFGNEEQATGANTLPPGFAALTQAAKELFLPEASDEDFTNIAAKGYIETANIGEKETNWDYFVTLDNTELLDLNRSMETVCLTIGGSNDEKIISESIRQMIETLTGDKLTTDDLADYWRDRNSIPLVTQTLLGDGMKTFFRDYADVEELAKYKKAFCRGYELTSLMQAKKKLPKPYDGGSLVWTGDFYESEGAVRHNWLYKDFFERGYYYLPLTYLPGWESNSP